MVDSSPVEFKKTARKACEILTIKKSPEECSKFISSVLNSSKDKDRGLIQWLGLSYMEAGQFELARKIFENAEFYYQAGYCELLQGNLEKAKKLWKKQTNSSVKEWSKTLETMVQGRLEYKPSFLGLRNYLEMDVGYLLRANQIKFAENIINLTNQLAEINLECFKFVGRALFNNGFSNLAVNFFLDGQKILPNDPEVYYHLGQYSLQAGAYKEARSMFCHCKLISASYTPADDRLKEMIEKNL